MRSLTLDTTSFTPNLVNLLRLLPNAVSNSVWEQLPNPAQPKPTAQSSYETRHAYITAKYVITKFIEPLPLGTSANQYLIGAILHGDLKGVLLALAHKADPNTRAPILPALVVALLQDDKAGSALGKTDSGSSNGSIQQSQQSYTFPFAELLVLNGATPVDPKTLPTEASSLSEAARQYLQKKLDRTNVQSPSSQHTLPSSKSQSSGLAGSGISSLSAQPISGGGTSASSIGGDLNRSMSKLQKRLSAGAKNLRTYKEDGQTKSRREEERE
jgi:Arf-GAP with SH3 domain, ANK repeat and PH domain-containing protein